MIIRAETENIRYADDPEGFVAYEATFPKKEKLKLPGRLFG